MGHLNNQRVYIYIYMTGILSNAHRYFITSIRQDMATGHCKKTGREVFFLFRPILMRGKVHDYPTFLSNVTVEEFVH